VLTLGDNWFRAHHLLCCQISAQKSGSTKGDERETNYRQELTP